MVSLFHCPAITTIMVQFKGLDQFRWPGWFIALVGMVYCGLFLLLYRTQRKLSKTEAETKEIISSEKCSGERVCSAPYACFKMIRQPTCKEVFVS